LLQQPGIFKKKNQMKKEDITISKKGFTLIEVMIVVAIIGLLAVIAVPSFYTAREKSIAASCKNNLRVIFQANQDFMYQNESISATAVTELYDYFKHENVYCPAEGSYSINASDVTCSIGGEHTLDAIN